jgi:hypothetical protein
MPGFSVCVSMAGMKNGIAIYAVIILILAFCAIKFSHHPVVWLIGLAASIPIFAAIAGAVLTNRN